VCAILKDGDLIVELESQGSVRVLCSTDRFQDEQADFMSSSLPFIGVMRQ
jgi:hypothetical protein